MRFQQTLMETLKDEPLNVIEIMSKTAVSEGYIRTQLKALEAAGLVERVDNRVPVYYRINPNNPTVRYEKEIATMLVRLTSKEEDINPVIELIKGYPKSTWEPLIATLSVTSAAIQKLKDNGKLIDTL